MKHILIFDLGGVLVEFKGFDVMRDWTGAEWSEYEFWPKWLSCEPVRLFESGKIGEGEFAEGVISEFGLRVKADEFLLRFSNWITGFYDGAEEYLRDLRGRHVLACLSNSNPIHWRVVKERLNVDSIFDYCFVSYELGHVKPDREIYEAVLSRLPSPHGRVVLFDDNIVNVEGAISAGMEAYLARGFEDCKMKLEACLKR